MQFSFRKHGHYVEYFGNNLCWCHIVRYLLHLERLTLIYYYVLCNKSITVLKNY